MIFTEQVKGSLLHGIITYKPRSLLAAAKSKRTNWRGFGLGMQVTVPRQRIQLEPRRATLQLNQNISTVGGKVYAEALELKESKSLTIRAEAAGFCQTKTLCAG